MCTHFQKNNQVHILRLQNRRQKYKNINRRPIYYIYLWEKFKFSSDGDRMVLSPIDYHCKRVEGISSSD